MSNADMSMSELRALAKEQNINTFQMGKDEILAALGTPVKRGRASWKPARKLDIKGRDENFVYRWCEKDPNNLSRKEAEGWTVANSLTDSGVEHKNPREMEDGAALGGATEYRELVLMKLPKGMASERADYYREINDGRVRSIHRNAQKKLTGAAREEGATVAEVHGETTIQRIS